MTITGQNFGPLNVELEVSIGGRACLETQKVSGNAVVCTVPPGRAGRKRIVVALGEGAHRSETEAPGLFSYYLTPAERLRSESKLLMAGLALTFPDVAIALHTQLADANREMAFRNWVTGAATVFHPSPDLLDVLPAADVARGAHETCAVVLNSALLLEAENGREIDLADAVFRFNNAPTKGFVPFVGAKTTYRFVQARFMRSMLARDPDSRKRAFRPDLKQTLIVWTETARELYILLKKSLVHTPMIYTSQGLNANIRSLYKELYHRFKTIDSADRPAAAEADDAGDDGEGDAGEGDAGDIGDGLRRRLGRALLAGGAEGPGVGRGAEARADPAGDPAAGGAGRGRRRLARYAADLAALSIHENYETKIEPSLVAGEPPPEFVGLLIALQFCKQVKVFGYEPPKSLENESGLSGIWDKDAAEAEQAAAEGPDAEKELSLQKAQQNRDLPYFRVYKGPDEIYDLHAGSESKAGERMEAGIPSTHIESAIMRLLELNNVVEFVR